MRAFLIALFMAMPVNTWAGTVPVGVAKVDVTPEISADIPDGARNYVVRTVTENCHTRNS